MIRRAIKPEEHADFGPVRLVSINGSAWRRPGQPMAMIQQENFQTAKMALNRAKERLGHSDFVTPFITSDESGRLRSILDENTGSVLSKNQQCAGSPRRGAGAGGPRLYRSPLWRQVLALRAARGGTH